MPAYRFIGAESEVGPHLLKRLGQEIELPADIAVDVMTKCPLLPASEFAEIGFTPDELKAYATPGAQMSAPPEFHEKLTLARMRWLELKEANNANG